jgi:hypothetical protein
MMLLGALSALLIAALLAAVTCAWLLAGHSLWRSRQLPPPGFDAQAALRRHPSSRARAGQSGLGGPSAPWSAPAPGQPTGPDDDPEFISALDRLIHGGDGGGGVS